MENIKIMLSEAGFTHKESSVYVTLLSLGTASAYAIAEKAGLKPSTTYLTLQNLITKNLAYTIPRVKKKLFAAKDPKEVIAELENRVNRTKRALPEMLALIPSNTPRLNIKYYQGLNGIREAMDYGRKHNLATEEVVGFYASAGEVPEEYIKISENYLIGLDRHGIHMRGITPHHKSIAKIKKLNESLGNSLRTIPLSEYSAQASIEAEDRLVRIILNDDQRAVIIEDDELAKMVKQIFEMVWKKKE